MESGSGEVADGNSNDEVILVVGDSLSAAYNMAVEDGWVALLEQRLDQHGHDYRIVNSSQSGATSRAGLAMLRRALAVQDPAIVIIELGANDGLQGLPLVQLRQNLATMIELSQAQGAAVVLTAIRIPPNYGQRYTEDFRAIYRELAKKYDTALVPVFLEKVALNPRLMQPDRVHPNEQAQPILLDVV
ncbi:MAG: arylesterase, partial [Gammaproteobacteria bacterium]|nr:arylesterase [Gammaproteobacteria bacterium]